ncbi:MAG: DUF2946 family protein, partial [Steroidobacterales bacterium]
PLGPAGVDDHSTHHQHGEHDHAGSHSSGHDHSQPACPFAAALVAAATPPTIAIGLTEPNVSAAERFAVAHEAPARFPLLRIQSPRAPPALI